MHFAPILRGAPVYDHVFCQGTEAIDILREEGIRKLSWLPMACDPDPITGPSNWRPRSRIAGGHDVVFVGSHYPMREKLFEALAGLDLAIWGPGWDRLRSDSPLRGCVRAAHTTPDTWRKIYAAAKIVLSVHFQDPLGKHSLSSGEPPGIRGPGVRRLCDHGSAEGRDGPLSGRRAPGHLCRRRGSQEEGGDLSGLSE